MTVCWSVRTRTLTRQHAHTLSLSHTHTHTLSLSLSLSHTHTNACIFAHTHRHAHAQARTRTHTHTHTHIIHIHNTHTHNKTPPKWQKNDLVSGVHWPAWPSWELAWTMNWVDRLRTSADKQILSGRRAVVMRTGRRAELLGVKLGCPRSRCRAVVSDVLCVRSRL